VNHQGWISTILIKQLTYLKPATSDLLQQQTTRLATKRITMKRSRADALAHKEASSSLLALPAHHLTQTSLKDHFRVSKKPARYAGKENIPDTSSGRCLEKIIKLSGC
jgi:hypothetical protein